MLSGLPAPRQANEKTVRMCDSDGDAISVAIVLSGLHQSEIAERMGISGGYLTLLKQEKRYMNSGMARKFSAATGWDVVRQYRELQMAIRVATGIPRHIDRIGQIAAHTLSRAA